MNMIENSELGTPSAVTEARMPAWPTSRTTKSAAVIKLLSRNKGATVSEIMAITHWRPHSTRAFLTGLRKKASTCCAKPEVVERRATGSTANEGRR